jgi:hypothetical protein
MARISKSDILVESKYIDGGWALLEDGFKSIPEAEAWIKLNIKDSDTLRVAKVSGVFTMKKTIIKR